MVPPLLLPPLLLPPDDEPPLLLPPDDDPPLLLPPPDDEPPPSASGVVPPERLESSELHATSAPSTAQRETKTKIFLMLAEMGAADAPYEEIDRGWRLRSPG